MPESAYSVDGRTIDELLSGERAEWTVGVCRLRAVDDGELIAVFGDDGTISEVVSTACYRPGEFDDDGDRVKDPDRIAEYVSDAIEREHRSL